MPHDSPAANERLAQAYQATFSGNATSEDAEIALVDMAVYSRFFSAAVPEASDAFVRHIDGRRSVMAWVLGMIADSRILGELQIAALREAIVTESQANKRKR